MKKTKRIYEQNTTKQRKKIQDAQKIKLKNDKHNVKISKMNAENETETLLNCITI